MTGMRTRTLVVLGVLLCGGCTSERSEPSSVDSNSTSAAAGGVFVPSSLEVARDSQADDNVVSRTVTFRNDSGAPLRIIDLKTSCSCTVVEDTWPDSLDAGESAEIPLEFHVPEYGSKQAKVTAVTAPPSENAILTVSLQGRPRQPPFFDAPNPVMTVSHVRGTPLKVATAVTCAETDASKPWLTEATVDSDAYGPLEVELVAIDPPSPYVGLAAVRRTYQVSVSAEPGALKTDRFEVRLMSGRQSEPERILAFHIDARRPVEVMPQIVRFTASAGQELAPRIAVLRLAEEDVWSCEVIESPDWLTVTPKPRDADVVSRLVLELDPGTAAGESAEGTVVIKVSAPGRSDMTCQLRVQRP